MAGSDGAYRFDALAPDTYKVSAMVGNPRTGMKSYSRQADVPTGALITLDLVVDPGTITVQVTAVPSAGALGIVSTALVSGTISAASATELSHKLASSGPGTTARSFGLITGVATFGQTSPGDYTACVAPLPVEVRGAGARCYATDRSDTLPVFCQPVTVAAGPDTQAVQVPVVVPAYTADPNCPTGAGGAGGGSGSGGGPGPGSGSGGPRGPGGTGPGSAAGP
jgi:hypothetical protein